MALEFYSDLRDGDYVTHILTTTAHAYLLFFSNLGKVYRLRGLEIPERERTAKGMPIAYGVSLVLIVMFVLLAYADIVNPVKLGN